MLKLFAIALLESGLAVGAHVMPHVFIVDVYIDADNPIWKMLARSKPLVSRIFADAGVALTWHTAIVRDNVKSIESDGRAFTIRTVRKAPKNVAEAALACAHPFGSAGATITLYGDRLEQFVETSNLGYVALAYVLAHELAHVMQGISRHSSSGILKARWSDGDCHQMRLRALRFTAEDVDLIHEGLVAKGLHWQPASQVALHEGRALLADEKR